MTTTLVSRRITSSHIRAEPCCSLSARFVRLTAAFGNPIRSKQMPTDFERPNLLATFKSPDSLSDPGVFPILGGIATLGEYYIHGFFGERKQKLRLQLDTGSSSLIVVGTGCENCTSKSSLIWNPVEHGISCKERDCLKCFDDTAYCGFEIKYGDDSPLYNLEASGIVAEMKVGLSREISKDVLVYVIQSEVGRWPKKVDGILGMAFERLNCNPTCFDLPWKTLAPPNSASFSICLGDVGGRLKFLQMGTTMMEPLSVTIPLTGKTKFYYTIKVNGLALVNKIAGSNEEEFLVLGKIGQGSALRDTSSVLQSIGIVDTGTTSSRERIY